MMNPLKKLNIELKMNIPLNLNVPRINILKFATGGNSSAAEKTKVRIYIRSLHSMA
jgi:hypothetical protein